MITTSSKSVRPSKREKRAAAVRERRQSTRVATMTAGRVGEIAVQVFDVSLDGVGFRSTSRLETGTMHEIVIGNGPMYLQGRIQVVNIRPRRDGTFDVGAVFV